MLGKRLFNVFLFSTLSCFVTFTLITQPELKAQENLTANLAATIAEAATDESREKLIAGAVTQELITALVSQISRLTNLGKFAAGRSLAEFTWKKAEQINYPQGVVIAYKYICLNQLNQGRIQESLRCYEQNLLMAEKANAPNLIAMAMLDIAMPIERLGNLQLALDYKQRALKIAEELKDIKLTYRTLANIGNSMTAIGDLPKSIEYYEQALQIMEQNNIQTGRSTVLFNLGSQLFQLGDYNQAMRHLHSSLRLAEEAKELMVINHTLVQIGIVHMSIQPESGIPYIERALKLAEQAKFNQGITFALNALASSKMKLGNLVEAEELIQRKLKLDESSQDKISASTSLKNLAKLYLQQDNYTRSLEVCQRKLELDISRGDKIGVIRTRSLMAENYFHQGNFPQSLQLAEQGIELARPTNWQLDLCELLILAGSANNRLGRRPQAIQCFTEAQQIAERVRKQMFGGEELQQASFGKWLKPYHELAILALDDNRKQNAFEQSQLSKARVLSDVLSSGHIKVKKYMTTSEGERESQLQARLTILNIRRTREMIKPEETSELKKLNAELEKAATEYDSFVNSLYALHPETKINRGEFSPLSLPEAGSLLTDSKSALLDFVVTEKETLLFVVTKEQGKETLATHRIAIAQSDLIERVSRFREALATRNLAIQQPAIELYNLLLKPAEKELLGKTSLTIFPDGPLWELPFQALQPKLKSYLIETYDLAYAPSLPALQAMNKQRWRKKPAGMKQILALGNPAFDSTQNSSTNVLMTGSTLAALPESERLVKELGQIYGVGSKIMVGAEATEKAFKENAGQYRILQLATHGLLNNVSPMYSSLMMAAPIANDKEDGLLEARELIEMDLNADIAILSACETGRGRISTGEGVIGLSWALQIAGCPTSVVSQWKVESTSTTELMLEFHRQLSKTQKLNPGSPSRALRQAMLKLLRSEQHKHPAYWAGFTVIGAN